MEENHFVTSRFELFFGKGIWPFKETKAVPLKSTPVEAEQVLQENFNDIVVFDVFFIVLLILDIEERRYAQLTNHCAHSNLL